MSVKITFFTIKDGLILRKIRSLLRGRRLLSPVLILGIGVVMGLMFTAAEAEAGSCTFGSTDTEYYVPANTTQDISGCGTITLDKPLRLRNNATLKGTTADVLVAGTEGEFIRMNTGARLKSVTVNGAFKADILVRVADKSDVWIVDCVIKNADHTHGDLTGKSRPHLIYVSTSQFVHIIGNTILNAAYHPNASPHASGTALFAHGIFAYKCKNIEISGNVIRRTLGAGIDFSGSVGVRIIDNDIRTNGLNMITKTGPLCDAIQGYKNNKAGPYQGVVDTVIANNYIQDYRRWAMHVSGRGLTVLNNDVITDPAAGTDPATDTKRQLNPLNIGHAVANPEDFADEPFSYLTPGDLIPGSGTGRVDYNVYLEGMRFPIEKVPAYANSPVWGVGGMNGPSGSQCHEDNYSYPWRDNFCETRGWTTPMCPTGKGHQGQDIRPSTCEDSKHWAVAAEGGTFTDTSGWAIYMIGDSSMRHTYMHLDPGSLQVWVGKRVEKGDRIGKISDYFGGTSTHIHLHYEIYSGGQHFPPYMSLVRAYEKLADATYSVETDCSTLATVTGNDFEQPNGQSGGYTQSVWLRGPYDPNELTSAYLDANNTLEGGVAKSKVYCGKHGAYDLFADDNDRYSERSNEWAAVTGLTSGCGDRQVCPTTKIRRKHMALFLYRLLKNRPGFVAPDPDTNSFSDDDDLPAAYQTAIEWLKANGITKNSGTFNPEGLVPREHMALFLYRAFNTFAEFVPAPGGDSFADTSRYEKEIGWLKANGITSGCGNGNFCPDNPVTREMLFVFLNRAATKTVY